MIRIDEDEIFGWGACVRGMRNSFDSWDKSDSDGDRIGPADYSLMKRLSRSGSSHAKFKRMIHVQCDVTAPLYWWKEFDTYKVGTVANSCSTMHTIADKEFELSDFSCEHLIFEEMTDSEDWDDAESDGGWNALNDKYCGLTDSDFVDFNTFPGECFKYTIAFLNRARELYLKTNDKKYWWQLIQLLPSSYNQKRTIDLNYEVLSAIHKDRRNHKLDEWQVFCNWIEKLPYAEGVIFTKKEKA